MIAVSCIALLLVFLLADRLWPLPDPERVKSVLILAEDRTPLRAFADNEGVWRYPVTLDEVSPLYVEALLTYEDRWFYQHPGINPLALLRAGWQWLRNGEIVSGGSTLTMQVARILDPHKRDAGGKLKQMFRALQLEWHYSKDDILTFYLNLAPFGGPIEGVQTASFAWLHKPSLELSHAEAALLAVLPQAPSRLRPDRHPELAQRYRDKVLRRMGTLGVWSADTVEDAMMETVARSRFQQPMMAPLFSRRMKERAFASGQSRLRTVLNTNIQWAVENILRNRLGSLPDQATAAVLVLENRSGYVRAYAGTAAFGSAERSGHVDMVQAVRSPGSTLKPFLYGMAMDDGLIHSGSLLSDVPVRLADYAPQNFLRNFSGAVSATQALQQSLNVPAVSLLQRVTPADFVSRLRNAGMKIEFPGQAEPNLSVILGGAGITLEDLVRGFTAFARQGVSIQPRFLADDPVVERRVLSAGAAWIVQDILRKVLPPEGSVNQGGVAWKTGTSYGFRDAWAVGVNDTYTVGVWTGRPDGTPLPGRFGAHTAGPIMFDIFRALPAMRGVQSSRQRPDSVSEATVCWPQGGRVELVAAPHCHWRQRAWILDGHVPPTLPNPDKPSWSAGLHQYWVNPATGLQVTSACAVSSRVAREVALWPLEVRPWLAAGLLEKMQLPAFDDACPEYLHSRFGTELAIRNLDASSRLYLPVATGVSIDLQADGGQGPYFWLVNGEPAGVDERRQGLRYTFTHPGDYELTVFDIAGGVDKVPIRVVSLP